MGTTALGTSTLTPHCVQKKGHVLIGPVGVGGGLIGMGGCSKCLAIYAPCSGVSTSSELTATAASPSKSSDAFDRLSLGKLGAPLSGLRHFGRGAVTGPVFGTDTASAFSLLTLLKGTETGPLCGGAPMQCLGVVCMPATAVSSPPATASLAILLDR